MKYFFIFITLMILVNCESEDQIEYVESSAVYKYDLPADGCDWHFLIKDQSESLQLIEDDQSASVTEMLKKEANKVIGLPSVKVEITYRLTGRMKKVQCGWAKIQEMNEINIRKVTVR